MNQRENRRRLLTREKQQAYHILFERLEMVRVHIHNKHPEILAMILFGSTARMTPHRYSDADILGLFDTTEQYAPAIYKDFVHTMITIDNALMDDRFPWPLSLIVGNNTGSDLDEDFLSCVHDDGVLVYCRDGYQLPESLTPLKPLNAWQASVLSKLQPRRKRAS